MTLYFHAADNYLYAKSCHFFVQDMQELGSKTDVTTYAKFTNR